MTAGRGRGSSLWRRRWAIFRANRRGYWSLVLFLILFGLSLFAEVLSNDRPLMVRYEGQLHFPLWRMYPETTFGGDFDTETDYQDPYIRERLSAGDNWVLFAPNPHNFNSINLDLDRPVPSPPTRENLLGILAGALQGYFGGRFDLIFQRFIELWGSMPELYLLIIFASIFKPSMLLLLVLLSLFGWMGLSDYVRAEFLKGRNMEYVKAARALGVGNATIMARHLLPNSMTPVITFLPFRMSVAILALTSLDFLGLGVPPSTPSLGELLAQGKANIEAWWLSLSTFIVLVGTLVLLIFIGEALREAFDPRK